MGRIWLLLVGVGMVLVLVSVWHRLAAALTSGGARPLTITIWSNSGDPDHDLMLADRFMADHPDIAVELRFRESGSIGEARYVAFLAGNPPYAMDVPLNQIDNEVAAGLVRPIDNMLEQALRQDPDFITRRMGGELEIFRYRANPRHPLIRAWRETGAHAPEAARMLNLHGHVIGFSSMGTADVLTWNRALVARAAAAGHPELLDEQGQPRAPHTWAELRHFSRIITQWGLETYGPDNPDRPYGLVVQGQRGRDILRGIRPLAATAGSQGFDHRGAAWVDGVSEAVGRFAYDDPAILGALKLLMLCQADGSVLPGTAARHFETPRTLLAEGRAAFLIDGSHAPMRGATTFPNARLEVAAAPLPTPWTTDEERAALEDMLGFAVGRGRVARDMGRGVSIITSGAATEAEAAAVWAWLNKDAGNHDAAREGIRNHYQTPRDREVAELLFHSSDPTWVELREGLLPFQREVWEAINAARVWPVEPAVQAGADVKTWDDVLHRAFLAGDGRRLSDEDLDRLLTEARDGLRQYSDMLNRNLAEAVQQGALDPDTFTFPDWTPDDPEAFFLRQRGGEGDPVLDQEVAALRAELPEDLRQLTGMLPPRAGPRVFQVLALVLALLVGYLAVITWRAHRGGPALGLVMAEARQHSYAYGFVLPAVLALIAFSLFPAINMLWLSFHSGSGQTSLVWTGLDQYRRLASDTVFLYSVLPNTFIYMLVVSLGEVSIALVLACLLNLPLRANRLYRILFFFPMVTSMAVISIVFIGLLGGVTSPVNEAIAQLRLGWMMELLGIWPEGNPVDLLNDGEATFLGLALPRWTVMAVAIWGGVASNTILCLAALQAIPADVYEAARVDGAGPWRRFSRITLPLLAPIVGIILFNSFIGAAKHFSTVYIMTEGRHGTEIFATYVYKAGFLRTANTVGDFGYAAALGVVYSLLLTAFAGVNIVLVTRYWRRRLAQAEAAR